MHREKCTKKTSSEVMSHVLYCICSIFFATGRNQYSILRLCKEIVADSAKSLFFFLFTYTDCSLDFLSGCFVLTPTSK